MAEKLYDKVKKYIKEHGLIEAGDLVIAGVSGGADSVCLFDLLSRLQSELSFALHVVHVNHGVRKDAFRDAEYVEQLCANKDIPFFLKEVDMEQYAAEHKLSSEEAGRILRYQTFSEYADRVGADTDKPVKIAVAHTANDRAETMLFHLFRGSGLTGVTSIRPIRDRIIRPILCLQREEVEEYLLHKGIKYCEDSTNAEDTYTRNRIRHHIIDYAEKQVCQGSVSHMSQFADDLLCVNEYLEQQTERLFQKYVRRCERTENSYTEEKAVDVVSPEETFAKKYEGIYFAIITEKDGFCAEPEFLQNRVFMKCLEVLTPHLKDITRRHVDSIRELTELNGSKQINLPYGLLAVKEYRNLYIGKFSGGNENFGTKEDSRKQESSERTSCSEKIEIPLLEIGDRYETEVSGEKIFVFELTDNIFCENGLFSMENIPENRYTKWFDYDKITTCLSLRTRESGDFLTVDEKMHRTSIKQYMINEKIPKTERDKYYMPADGAHILWVPGYRISEYYKVDQNTKRVLKINIRGGNHGREN